MRLQWGDDGIYMAEKGCRLILNAYILLFIIIILCCDKLI
jgi:hypothetical protein